MCHKPQSAWLISQLSSATAAPLPSGRDGLLLDPVQGQQSSLPSSWRVAAELRRASSVQSIAVEYNGRGVGRDHSAAKVAPAPVSICDKRREQLDGKSKDEMDESAGSNFFRNQGVLDCF